MRKANTILRVIRDRGRQGLPLERVYPPLFNPDLYLCAHGNLYSNKGALTKGVTEETVDGMSMEKIHTIIEACASSDTDGSLHGGPISRKPMERKGRLASQFGRTKWSKRC